MAEVVDSIIAELEVRYQQYVDGFDKATAAHERFTKSVPKIGAMGGFTQAEAQQYTDRHTKASDAIASGEEKATQRVTRTRKARTDATTQADAAEARSAKASADAVVAAETKKRAAIERTKAAEREASNQARAGAFLTPQGSGKSARDSAAAFREAFKQQADEEKAAAAARAAEPAARQPIEISDRSGFASRPNADHGPRSTGGPVVLPGERSAIPASPVLAEAAAEKEINQQAVERIRLQDGLLVAKGQERAIIREQIADQRVFNQLVREGLTEEAAAVELERLRGVRAAERNRQEQAQARSASAKDLARFGEGAGLGRAYGSTATVAGIAVAGVVAGGVAAVASGIDYAKEIKNTADAVGLTTRQVQVYEAAARQAGVSTDQFRSGIGQLNSYLGRAKEGDEQAAKTFKTLGVNIKDAGSAGDVLPTLIDRISSIKDPAQRAAVETRLFGEEGRRLDSLLSGGNQKIGELAEALTRTGAILSSSDIAKLNDTEQKLAGVKAQLEVDLAQVIAGNANAILSLANAFAALANSLPAALTQLDIYLADAAKLQGYGQIGLSYLPGFEGRKAVGEKQVADSDSRIRSLRADQDTRALDPALAGVDGDDAFLRHIRGDDAKPGKVGNLNGLFAPKPRKGKSADELEAEAQERTKRFNDQLAGYQEQQLRAQEQQTGDIQEQASIESQISERARQRQIDDINGNAKRNILKGANAEIENVRAAQLRDAVNAATAAQSDAREQGVTIALRNQENQHLQTRLGIETELLEGAQGLARTSTQRLAIQLRLLDIEKQQERAALEIQLKNEQDRHEDTTDTKAKIASLDQRFGAKAANAREQNLTPGQTYVRSLTPTSDDIQDKQIALLNRFNQGLDDSVAKALHLHGIFGDIVKDLIDMAIKQALIKPLAQGLFGADPTSGATGGLGGLFGKGAGLLGKLFSGSSGGFSVGATDASSILSDFSGGISLPGFATGGSFDVGGNPGIDRNLLSINGVARARVGADESIAIVPRNLGSANGRVANPGRPMILQQTINVDGRNSVTPEGFAQQIIQVSADHANKVAARAGTSAVQAAPAQVKRVQTLRN